MSGGIPRFPSGLSAQIKVSLPREAQFDPSQPDTLGWRAWYFLIRPYAPMLLSSPHMHTLWPTAELHVDTPWVDDAGIRGVAGIHARRMPYDWRKAGWPAIGEKEGPMDDGDHVVTGVVERFGRYVMGSKGWRAEWVIVRALMAKTTTVGLQLEQQYPEIPVYYREEANHGHR
jgi:hypothetical protein